MNYLVYHIASGQAFFSGIALIIIATLASTRRNWWAGRVAFLACILGTILIAISSTAIPYLYYAFALLVTIVWAFLQYSGKWRRWTPLAVITAWVLAVAFEIPYHIAPKLNPVPIRFLTVIGDSVTAGMGGGDESETWPTLFAKEHNVVVQDVSHVGETAATALKRVNAQGINSPLVLLEIGGNDLLGSTSSSQFLNDLNALLEIVCVPGRQVVMFELPLPPFCHEYGRIQRSLANKYNVALVPKRVFLSVLAGDGDTLDTVHLTQEGHRRMANCVWDLVGAAFPK